MLNKIQNDIKSTFYVQNFPNDGQRFVAWYLKNIYHLSDIQVKDSVTDGQKDKQIDAVYIDDDNEKIHIIQGKFYTGDSVNGEPVREVITVHSKLADIKTLQQDCNAKLAAKLSEVSQALEDNYAISYELITTSKFTEDAHNDIVAFQKQLADEDNHHFDAELTVVDKDMLKIIFERAAESDNPTINCEIQLTAGKYLVTNIANSKVIISALPLKECIKIPGIKEGTLFQKNVRQSLGISNVVNKKIKQTILGDKCNDFFFFHNGITGICKSIEVLDGDKISLKELSVVNGCQSLNTILSCSESIKNNDETFVLFRFYEIPQRDRADSISINTNTQSAVKARDLRSNDKRVLRLKLAYENKYPNGYFATKRGEQIPADKDKNYAVDLSNLGKYLMAWYSQRPNISYGEKKIFDVYFNILFKPDFLPEDIFALEFWMQKIQAIWTDENPLGLNPTYLTMKAYAPYHFLYAISALFARENGHSDVPSPSKCYEMALKNNLVDTIIGICANCMNTAFDTDKATIEGNGDVFIPQNWIKNKRSINAVQGAVTNYVNFLPTMNKQMADSLKNGTKLELVDFSYRLQAD